MGEKKIEINFLFKGAWHFYETEGAFTFLLRTGENSYRWQWMFLWYICGVSFHEIERQTNQWKYLKYNFLHALIETLGNVTVIMLIIYIMLCYVNNIYT